MPPNTTSVLQPCDQGIIKTFKLYYRKLLVKYLLEISENEKEFTPLTVSQAIIFILFIYLLLTKRPSRVTSLRGSPTRSSWQNKKK